MARNVEIKARVSDLATMAAKVAAIADGRPTLIEQEDTFFHCAHGRLKLRALSPTQGELISYERTDEAGPKESRYVRTPCADPQGLKEVLGRALGIRGVIRKRRLLFHVGQTRIHLDEVEDLGDFLELEVVLRDDQDVADGAASARRIMNELSVEEKDLVSQAYIDLLVPGAMTWGLRLSDIWVQRSAR
jgi:predicted adenylyl cyclase CyaB